MDEARCAGCGELVSADELRSCSDCGKEVCEFCVEGRIRRNGEVILRCPDCDEASRKDYRGRR